MHTICFFVQKLQILKGSRAHNNNHFLIRNQNHNPFIHSKMQDVSLKIALGFLFTNISNNEKILIIFSTELTFFVRNSMTSRKAL